MAAPTSAPPAPADYFSTTRSTPRRPAPAVQQRLAPTTPGSPRTPLVGRSISAQFGSPGSFRGPEQEDTIIYELSERQISAGFAAESRPRCCVAFTPESARREGDYRQYDSRYDTRNVRGGKTKKSEDREDGDYVLYTTDIRSLDLGLVSDKLARALRTIHTEHLQLDSKPRKAVLAIPSLLPTPLLEVALQVLFTHYTQPPTVSLLTTPILACVGAGQRDGLIVEIGWEEVVVTAVGEYKAIAQRRSTRAGRRLVRQLLKTLEDTTRGEDERANATGGREEVPFAHAEEILARMCWCRPYTLSSNANDPANADLKEAKKHIPLPTADSAPRAVSLDTLASPADEVFFAKTANHYDDDDLPLAALAYLVLLRLPVDLRATCLSRIIVTSSAGPSSAVLPGLKQRFLAELHATIETRGWDVVASYGSAARPASNTSRALKERAVNIAPAHQQQSPSSSTTNKLPAQEIVPPNQRPHDDVGDPVSQKAERNHGIGRHRDATHDNAKAEIRGIETRGAWAGASLVAGLRVKGVHEVEREEFLRYGVRDSSVY